MADLPDEILLNIFRRLSFIDLGNVSQVCPTWERVARDKSLKEDIDLLQKIASVNHIRDEVCHTIKHIKQEVKNLEARQKDVEMYRDMHTKLQKSINIYSKYSSKYATDTINHLGRTIDLVDNEIAKGEDSSILEKKKEELNDYAEARNSLHEAFDSLKKIRTRKIIDSHNVFYRIRCEPDDTFYDTKDIGLFSTHAKAYVHIPNKEFSEYTYYVIKITPEVYDKHNVHDEFNDLDKSPDYIPGVDD